MIYSPNHNFLLIKNSKVGGTSLEVELSKILPENAIVTPIYPKVTEHIPRNHNNEFYNHISYEEAISILKIKTIKSYVTVRNPYNVVLSAFFHQLQDKNNNIETNKIKEKDFLLDEVDAYFKGSIITSKHQLYTKNKKIIVDKILFYENNIENEINKVLPIHGIEPIKIKAFEKKYRPEWANYKNLFNKKQIEIINKEWSWEFKNLGYTIE
jgi:hypothetical protein